MASPDAPAATRGHDDVLQFDRIEVARFHGLEHGLSVDLCGGINVIYGANASGKTTLALALRALLWPERVDEQLPLADGRFRLQAEEWRVELEGDRCRFLREQEPAGCPPLPPATHAPRYHIYLQDLLGAGQREEALAQHILREAQGGVDVEGAAESLGFEVPSRRTASLTKEVETLNRRCRETRHQQQALRRREQTLDDLREKRVRAQRAARRAAALEQALEAVKARRALDEAEAAVAAFPDALASVRGDEVERLEALQAERNAAERRIEDAEIQLEEARATLRESRIPEEGLPDGRLETLRTRAATLLDREGTVQDRRADVEAAESREAEAWARLPAGGDREKAADIALPEVETMDEHVQAVEDFRGRKNAIATARQLFGEDAPDVPVDSLREGLKHLHRWLQLPTHETPETKSTRWVVRIAGLTVLACGGGLTGWTPGVPLWVGAGLIVLGVLIVGAEWADASDSSDAGNRRALIEDEYRRLDLDPPAEWSREAVQQRADALLKHLRTAAITAEKREAWKHLQSEVDLDQRAEALNRERTRLAETLGMEPDVGAHSLSWLLDRLSRWQKAYDDLAAARAGLSTAKQAAEAVRTQLDDGLTAYDLGPVTDGTEAQGAVETLAAAQTAFREARRDLEQAARARTSAVQDRQHAEDALADLYAHLDLEEGAEEALRTLVRQYEAYQEAVEAARSARARLEAERRRLRREEEHAPWMEDATREELQQALDAAEAEADNEEDLVDRITTIEHEIQTAREEGTLEEQQAKYRTRRDALADERRADYRKAVGRILADIVEERTRDRGLPSVFRRARALFANITNHRYELTLDRSSASFRAVDTVREQSFALDELSSGTQVQLILSVRIAFLETQEEGGRVPLVLDEVLANSDTDRARAIMEAVATISEEGRQVLYLTAQSDEVQKWRAALDGREGPEYAVVSLDDPGARSPVDDGREEPAVPTRRSPPALPDSGGVRHEELRNVLEIPPWTPRRPVGTLHLWYLIEKPDALLALLKSGTRTWGQLETRYRLGGPDATPFDEQAFRRVQARAQAVEAWKQAWHLGRGRPVNRPVLEQTDAVTDRFVDGVSELADELNGDAEALMAVIRERDDERVRGFRTAKADALAAYFREHGYLTDREPLSGEDMWQRILAHLGTERQDDLVSIEALERLFDRLGGPASRD